MAHKPILNYPSIQDRWNGMNSVYPCTDYLTFGPWIYMVPQYKPESVLFLGYAGGTTAGLIRKLYGDDIKISAVDIDDCSECNWYDVEIITADAQEWIKTAPSYDTIVVDIYSQGLQPPDFVFSPEFVKDVSSRCRYLIVDATELSDMSAYKDLKCIKVIGLNQNRFYYYLIDDTVPVPIR